ncbi:MAG: efflux RND transporter periplasmic adaptor subunit [Candidatus Omnitrophota bacterium]|nr:MAG: efflux RND transporter periplasmic adaptor subunit [Candidatus Omnitrophota bacterium]
MKIDFKKNYVIIIVIMLFVGLILARTFGSIQRILFKRKITEEAAELELLRDATPVKIYKVKKMNFKDTLPVMGNIKGFKEVDLRFETNGILESFNFEEGERIQEGDIMANLNQRDSLLKLKYAELEVEKAKKLFEVGGMDKIKFEQTKLEYESAKSDFERTNIYAVSDGILGSRDMDVGSYVTPNDKIGVFVDISNVYATFDVIEKDSPKVKLGQKAEVFVDAYPAKTFRGTLDSISPIVKGRTRTQNIKIELKNPEFDLKPGMFVRALISTYEKDNALIIPTSAFKKKDADYFVYVVHKEKPKEKKAAEKGGEQSEREPVLETGVVEIRKVEIAYLTQDVAEIAKGIKENELIIVEAFQEFKNKEKVEISEMQETIF